MQSRQYRVLRSARQRDTIIMKLPEFWGGGGGKLKVVHNYLTRYISQFPQLAISSRSAYSFLSHPHFHVKPSYVVYTLTCIRAIYMHVSTKKRKER